MTFSEEEKRNYLEARETIPEIVAAESDPCIFHRVCDGDIWAAAHRLASYWNYRKELFGERAHLPMTLSGQGALTKEDILTLQAGFPAFLPRTKDGRQVLYCDRRQWIESSTLICRMRCFFYAAHKLGEEESAQTKGVYVISILSMPRMRDPDRGQQRKVSQMISSMATCKIYILQLCFPPRIMGSQYLVQDFITNWLSFWQSPIDNCGNTIDFDILIEQEPGNILNELLELNFNEKDLPPAVGGGWNFVEASNWVRKQIAEDRLVIQKRRRAELQRIRRQRAKERKREEESGMSPSVVADNAPSCVSSAASVETNSSRKKKKKKQLTDEEKQEMLKKRRAVNAIHSRRKRERRRYEEESLKSEHAKLSEDNERLKNEHTHLTSLLNEARLLLEA